MITGDQIDPLDPDPAESVGTYPSSLPPPTTRRRVEHRTTPRFRRPG